MRNLYAIPITTGTGRAPQTVIIDFYRASTITGANSTWCSLATASTDTATARESNQPLRSSRELRAAAKKSSASTASRSVLISSGPGITEGVDHSITSRGQPAPV